MASGIYFPLFSLPYQCNICLVLLKVNSIIHKINVCITVSYRQSEKPLAYADSIGQAFYQKGRLMAVEEISNLLVWSNKFDDPLDSNEYRIDGICFEGKFISSLTGEEINFKDYPLFDTTNCKDGDSLIYLQDTNTFDTASVNEKYKSLMTYPKIGIIEKCPTVNRFICSGGGSCINEKCECDPWSTGDACQCKINFVFDIFKCICFDFIPFFRC